MLPFNLDTLKKTYTPALKNGTRKMARPHTAFVPLLASFAPISLAQMAGVALLDRMDTKYVMSETQLYQALTTLREEYWVLDINAVRLNQYRTLYFDTADFMLYHRHHAGGTTGTRFAVANTWIATSRFWRSNTRPGTLAP